MRTNSKEKNFRPFQKKECPAGQLLGSRNALHVNLFGFRNALQVNYWVAECLTDQFLGLGMPYKSSSWSRNALQALQAVHSGSERPGRLLTSL